MFLLLNSSDFLKIKNQKGRPTAFPGQAPQELGGPMASWMFILIPSPRTSRMELEEAARLRLCVKNVVVRWFWLFWLT